MTVRAKFRVSKVAVFGDSGRTCNMYKGSEDTGIPMREITLSAVYADADPENASFAQATPNGTITFTLSNPAVADEFQPGHTYYVDFTPVEKK